MEIITENEVLEKLQRLQIRVIRSDTNELAIRLRIEHEEERMSFALFKDRSNSTILSTHWSLPNDTQASEMLARCNQLNSSVNYAKAQYILRSNSLLISAEWITIRSSDFAEVLMPYLAAIRYTREALTT